jgi:Actinobacteria/chloroflexi VLRF1 release factor
MRQPLVKNVAGAGAKWLDISAERFPGWISSFARRHGDSGSLGMTLTDGLAVFTAADGAVAECHPPFPESFAWPVGLRTFTGLALDGSSPREITAAPLETAGLMAAHAQVPRSVGVLLVRLGGYAAGVFTGYPPVLADAKTGSRLVHGRSAAGGWSQHRFARRREKQAGEALDAAAATAVAVFGRGHRLDAVVLGGDKRAVAGLPGDPRLAPYLALATERFLTVPDPKRAVLESTPKLFLAVRIRLTEPSR